MNREAIVIALAVALGGVLAATPIPAGAQEDDARERQERFQLFTNCALVVPDVNLQLDGDHGVSELTEERLQRAIDSRLRAARLYESPDPTLRRTTDWTIVYASVHVVAVAFHVQFEHRKLLRDPMTSETGTAGTWDRSVTGTHGGDGEYIVGPVTRFLDEFLDEYLRVNEAACTTRQREG
ncbi:hypothetical protein [Candidatus Palauibacter sp.]|uniref:hypothetical protein n=1 Tax=Candidatus Palauibacter sp. TaxID=3101350 RepID=UPI003B01A59D